MKSHRFPILSALLVLLIGSFAFAGAWQQETVQTATQSSRVQKAWTVNAEGHQLRLLRGATGPVFAVFELSGAGENEFGTREPLYRVDGGPPRLLADYGSFLDLSSKFAEWPIWDGAQPPCDGSETVGYRSQALCEILQGNRIEFQYYLVTGQARKTAFSLDGLRSAVKGMLD